MLSLIRRLLGKPEVVDPSDPGTDSADIYTLELDAILRRLVSEGFVALDDEDDTANFYMEMEELDDRT